MTLLGKELKKSNKAKVLDESSADDSHLTLKAPPIICSRRQFQILPLFQK